MKIWIEKTIIKDRKDRLEGERALGKRLWSPQKDKRGADIYKNMRLVEKGDIVIHLIDNELFSGVSRVVKTFEDAEGLPGTDWEGPAYMIELENYTEFAIPIKKIHLLNEKNSIRLLNIRKNSEVFYTKELKLRQGAYLTPCSFDLLNLINEIYKNATSQNLPLIDIINLDVSIIKPSESFNVKNLTDSMFISNLKYENELVQRFVGSLLTKPFVILTGLSGSGKTKMAQAFAEWMCESHYQICLIPVGADWTSREPLLGYPNALDQGKYVKPDNGVLDLLLNADSKPELPFFLILDEMNLSHVERYFADFLSAIESDSAIPLHSDDKGMDANDETNIPYEIEIPSNLFIIGTVNIDETTYMFSPKVLDRANVLEFRVSENDLNEFLDNPVKPDLDKMRGAGAGMAADFLRMAREEITEFENKDAIKTELLKFFKELKKTGAEFGYRTSSEIFRFAGIVRKLTAADGKAWEADEIIDAAVLQKLLPKLHGSKKKLEHVLRTLALLCLKNDIENPENMIKEFEKDPDLIDADENKDKIRFKRSLEKILRMKKRADQDGFTSFAEA